MDIQRLAEEIVDQFHIFDLEWRDEVVQEYVEMLSMAPGEGFAPPTYRLTADRSATELPRNKIKFVSQDKDLEFSPIAG